jgi:hypothetical protein
MRGYFITDPILDSGIRLWVGSRLQDLNRALECLFFIKDCHPPLAIARRHWFADDLP